VYWCRLVSAAFGCAVPRIRRTEKGLEHHPTRGSLAATRRLLLQGGAVDQRQFINFVRQRGLAVIATRGADGAPQAALIGITATERGELVFDTSRSSRKYGNLSAFAQVALVIGWDNEMTVQCEGIADIPTGADHDRCLQALGH
jgi:hypothetical protein